jgi:uncharacterized phage-associated protein
MYTASRTKATKSGNQVHMSIPSLFSERKAAETAAFLLHKAGGSLPLIKLVKLIYLAERLSFSKYGEPLTGDKLVSMDHGPVVSRIYNHMNGALPSEEGGWDTWVSDRANNMLTLRDSSMIRSPEQDLMSLSDSDIDVLNAVWSEFGHWDKWVLVKYTHDNLPEWEDPEGSSKPISYSRLFEVLGFGGDHATELMERLTAQGRLSIQFS